GKRVALANKESLVIAGDLIKQIIGEDNREKLIPVDSEHSAILQCLQGESIRSIESIIITASGGPFRKRPWKSFKEITPSDALNHPTWEMGRKISIDSATLMNKGFEVIEAHHLFDLSYDRIRVVIHPESIIHSMVEFFDGAVMAQCGLPDMELPIQYALSYPERLPIKGKRFKPAEWSSLHFEAPDKERFPCLSLCMEAGKMGMTYPAVLNAANEVAVSSFLAGEIGFTDIPAIIEHTMNTHSQCRPESLEVLIDTDTETRAKAKKFIKGKL
ncbi:MAG: 1-deoxy-D-xylulose-5-phosphate reductoisomerase, partial [Chitinivibrionales bacterium]